MAPEEKKKRRRRKPARTEDFSSDSSSSSSEDESDKQVSQSNNQEPEKMDIDLDLNVDEVPDDESNNKKNTHPELHPLKLIPEELKDISKNDEKFQEYYLQLVTTQFSDDLDKLRQSKDFGEKSLGNLINALKEGSHIFSTEEKEIINESL